MGGNDDFMMIELIFQSIIACVEELLKFIVSLFQDDQKQQGSRQSQQETYDRLTSNYIGNMNEAQQNALLAMANQAVAKAKVPGITGKDVVDFMKVHQEEKIEELQKKLEINEKRQFKAPEKPKETFIKEIKPKVEKLSPHPSLIIGKEHAFVTKAPRSEQFLSIHKRAFDGSKLKDVIKGYYSQSTTKIPNEILVTGNTKLLQNYVNYAEKNKILDPQSNDMLHLKERIQAMNQINAYGEYNHLNSEEKGVKPKDEKVDAKAIVNEQQVQVKKIKGVQLGRQQDTGNGCWSCAMEVLFSGLGVQVDQSLIRAFKPEFTNLSDCTPSPQEIDNLLSDSQFGVLDCAELVGKVSPNTTVTSMSSGDNTMGTMIEKVNKLVDRNVPVAFSDGSHWKTIVGSDQEYFYVINSTSDTPNVLQPVSKLSLVQNHDLQGKGYEFTWMEKMEVSEKGEIKGVNKDDYTVNPQSGAIMKGENFSAVEQQPVLGKDGNYFLSQTIDPDTNKPLTTSKYLPKAFRKYDMEYSKQKELIEKDIPSPKEVNVDVEKYKYTYMSSLKKDDVIQNMNKAREKNFKQQVVGYSKFIEKADWEYITDEIIQNYESEKLEEGKQPYEKITVSEEVFEQYYKKEDKYIKPGNPQKSVNNKTEKTNLSLDSELPTLGNIHKENKNPEIQNPVKDEPVLNKTDNILGVH